MNGCLTFEDQVKARKNWKASGNPNRGFKVVTHSRVKEVSHAFQQLGIGNLSDISDYELGGGGRKVSLLSLEL